MTNSGFLVRQPVFQHAINEISYFTLDGLEEHVQVAKDSLFIQPDLVDSKVGTASWIPEVSGWHVFADSLELYVYDRGDWQQFFDLKQVSTFLQQKGRSATEIRTTMSKVPDWVWFGLITACLGMLWLEPRI